jgi:hypothetical protein
MWVVTTVDLLSLVLPSAPIGIQGVTCVMVVDETFMYWGHDGPSAVAW